MERQARPLSNEGCRRYEECWEEVERAFVNNPEGSVEMADRTVPDLLEERNFVADAARDDRETERGLAAVYPEVADDYRGARSVRVKVVARSTRGPGEDQGYGDADDLLQIVRKYRSVYWRLIGD